MTSKYCNLNNGLFPSSNLRTRLLRSNRSAIPGSSLSQLTQSTNAETQTSSWISTLSHLCLWKFFPSSTTIDPTVVQAPPTFPRHTNHWHLPRESLLPPSLPPILLKTEFQFERVLHNLASRRDRSWPFAWRCSIYGTDLGTNIQTAVKETQKEFPSLCDETIT